MESKNRSVGLVVIVAVAILFGVIAIGVIADQLNSKTALKTQTDTITIQRFANMTVKEDVVYTLDDALFTGWRAEHPECEVQTITFKNQTGVTLTDPTHYVFVMDVATLTLVDGGWLNGGTSNTTTATYQYCPDDYITGWSQTVLNLIPGFFAIALIGAALFLLWKVTESEGLDFNSV